MLNLIETKGNEKKLCNLPSIIEPTKFDDIILRLLNSFKKRHKNH